MVHFDQDTIVAQSTPVGEGAIGIIRLSGSKSREIASRFFQGKKDPLHFESHKLYLGYLINPHTKEPLDQVMMVWMKEPDTFTGEEMVEIQAHGGYLILQRILKTAVDLGARLAEPGEFSKRAYLNGKIDLSQAEAIADLIHAKSEWAAKNALSQLGGTLSQTIHRLKEKLTHFLALVEVGFDFVEEDVTTFDFKEGVLLLEGIQKEIGLLLDSFKTGQLYKEGLKVALIGKPNVGKSSLLNVLLNEERAIVHEEPGTTRDIVSGERKIEGIVVTFYDTAGIRPADNAIEYEGIKRSTQTLEKADLIFLLLDSSQPLTTEDKDLLKQISQKPHIVIYSKIDLPPVWDSSLLAQKKESVFKISSKNREGIEGLLQKIEDLLIHNEVKKDHNYVLNNVRHKKSLQKVYEQLSLVIESLQKKGLTEECLVEELRNILKELSEITGEVTTETILDEVFSKFCIGK